MNEDAALGGRPDRRPVFQTSEEATSWADQWASARVPSPLVVDLAQAEKDHFRRFNTDYGRFVLQTEAEFTCLADLIDQLNFVDRSDWPTHRAIQFALVAHNLKTFYSAFDRLVRGHYDDATTLIRVLYETFVRLLFISCHPDNAYSALGFKPPKGVRRFNLTNFLADDLGLDWSTKYEIMSVFAHSNSFRVLESLRRALERTDEPERFGLSLSFDARSAETVMPFFQFVLLTHLRFAVERLAIAGLGAGPQALAESSGACDLLSYGLRTSPKTYWRDVANDLDLLFEMLDIADTRGDWRAFLRTSRAENPT